MHVLSRICLRHHRAPYFGPKFDRGSCRRRIRQRQLLPGWCTRITVIRPLPRALYRSWARYFCFERKRARLWRPTSFFRIRPGGRKDPRARVRAGAYVSASLKESSGEENSRRSLADCHDWHLAVLFARDNSHAPTIYSDTPACARALRLSSAERSGPDGSPFLADSARR